MNNIYEQLKRRVFDLWKEEGLLSERISIRARALSTKEAIGNPEHQDFPIQKGKEKLMQANIHGCRGARLLRTCTAITRETLEQVLHLPMENNHQRAVFVASLNAVLRHLGRIGGSIHCRDEEPVECGKGLVPYLKDRYSGAKIAHVGFQPRMVENLGAMHPLRVLDMDPDNIGARKFGVTIESADHTEDAVNWADLILATGTVLANGSVAPLLGKKTDHFFTAPPLRAPLI